MGLSTLRRLRGIDEHLCGVGASRRARKIVAVLHSLDVTSSLFGSGVEVIVSTHAELAAAMRAMIMLVEGGRGA